MAAVDLLVIGGGVNGCAIARDAAGRGLSVLLVEQGDLAQATSSASTKLFHGGLRYLEYYEFRLVRESLIERETLLKAIEKVAAGETFVDPALIPSLATGRDGQEILTAREREILQLLADGMSNADVAQQLFISQETVKSHVRHILAKLEAETRTQAVAIALREAMID